MLLKILAWFWIITGVIFLIKPEWMRNKLQKKSVKKIRRFFFGISLVLGGALIGATWGKPGILPLIIMIAGFIGIIKAFFFLKAQAAEKIIEWLSGQSTGFLRMACAAQIAFGVLLLCVK